MARTGRPRTPDVIKRIRANPGNRPLAPLDESRQVADQAAAADLGDQVEADQLGDGDQAPPLAPPSDQAARVLSERDVEIPDFLTKPREREIFRRVMTEFVPKQIARGTDAGAYARWAAYFARWLTCKEVMDSPEAGDGFYLVESKHGKRLAEHPAFKMMMTLELAIVRLELQLGLTPLSRQSIMRGLGVMAGAAAAGLFGNDAEADKAEAEAEAGGDDSSPLGLLARAASPSPFRQ